MPALTPAQQTKHLPDHLHPDTGRERENMRKQIQYEGEGIFLVSVRCERLGCEGREPPFIVVLFRRG